MSFRMAGVLRQLSTAKLMKIAGMYYELGYARAVVKGNLNYPEYAKNATAQEQENAWWLQWIKTFFWGKAINLDPTLPYGHLELFPGGGAENKPLVKSPAFLIWATYDLEADANEQVNLVKNPEYAKKSGNAWAEGSFGQSSGLLVNWKSSFTGPNREVD